MSEEVIECFYLVPTDYQRVSLRRWSRRGCPGKQRSVCHSKTPLTIVKGTQPSGDLWPHDDIRWPQRCSICGTSFREYDHWQLFHETIYQWWGTDIELTISEAPPGAMWDAYWFDGMKSPGPDGRWLYCRLPDGKDWFVDGPSRNDQNKKTSSWSRSGRVPYITVTPGVKTENWDGRLIDGLLIPNIDVDLKDDEG